MELQNCPSCNTEYPLKHFRCKGVMTNACRVCRDREAARKRMRLRRMSKEATEKLEKAVARRKAKLEDMSQAAIEKRLKSRFLEVTRRCRTRLNYFRMKNQVASTRRSVVAMRVRERELEHYEMVYRKQLDILHATKVMPSDILDFDLD